MTTQLPELALGPRTWSGVLAHELVPPSHRCHTQAREVTQVLSPRCLLWTSDCGGLFQLGPGCCEVCPGQESHRQHQRHSARSKISWWLGRLSGSCSGSSFWGCGSPVMTSTAVMRMPRRERTISRKKKTRRHRDLDAAGGGDTSWTFGCCWPPTIHPEDIVNFSLIRTSAWTASCTAAFWTRLCGTHSLHGGRLSLCL